MTGTGYGPGPGAAAGSSISGAGGSSYAQISVDQLDPLLASGQAVYYQPTPGNFVALPAGSGYGNEGGVVGNTPLLRGEPDVSSLSIPSWRRASLTRSPSRAFSRG